MPAAMAKRPRSSLVLSSTNRVPQEAQARLLRVIAHPVRLMILQALSGRSRCVKDLNALVSVSQPHLSQHMAALRRAKLVNCHSSGNLRCYYVLQPTLVRGLVRLLSRDHPIRLRDRSQVVGEAMHAIGNKKQGGAASRRRRKRSPPPSGC
jgi:ArsR family transcriptional regulator